MSLRARDVGIFLIVGLIIVSSLPVSAQNSGEAIGRYVRIGMEGHLTADDVEPTGNGIAVEGPWMTSKLKVSGDWLSGELGAWGAYSQYRDDVFGRAVIDDSTAEFAPFSVSAEPIFSRGSIDSVLLMDRPMWISGEKVDDDHLRLTFDDGNSAGQPMFVSKTWLWDQGILNPKVVHEDGLELAMDATADGLGYLVHMPHFSSVNLYDQGVVYSRLGSGLLLPHAADWNSATSSLTINVTNHLVGTKTIYINHTWALQNIPPGHWDVSHTGSLETVGGTTFMTFVLQPYQTPGPITVYAELPGVDVLVPNVGMFTAVQLGEVVFLQASLNELESSNDECPITESGYTTGRYLGTLNFEDEGSESGATYTHQVMSCYHEVGTEAHIYWKMYAATASGKHLSHAEGLNPCEGGAFWGVGHWAYCYNVINAGDGAFVGPGHYFTRWAPDEDLSGSCSSVTLSLTYGGAGFEWSPGWCKAGLEVQAKVSSLGKWAQQNPTSGAHSAHALHYGVTQHAPQADGTFSAVIDMEAQVAFHCFWENTCVLGAVENTYEASKSADGEAWNLLAADLALGDQQYSYQETLQLLNMTNPPPEVSLATALTGAKMLIASGVVPSTAILQTIIDADDALSGYGEQVPWQSHVPDTNETAALAQLEADLRSDFVAQLTASN